MTSSPHQEKYTKDVSQLPTGEVEVLVGTGHVGKPLVVISTPFSSIRYVSLIGSMPAYDRRLPYSSILLQGIRTGLCAPMVDRPYSGFGSESE